ncbi:MAG TPA: 2-amino-4-hydroxy-6-hydroxymethyldihydropteridine diphosphokinase [Burkholderiales bacterium]|nr:2-amino-4-hydroxy-6-hydroxymethyldihydropteridine diphosphokinase [Burkholderiales bacterium]
MTLAYVGIGANLDDPAARVRGAFASLDGMRDTRVLKRSSLYRSAPLGHRAQPDFVNAVAELDTALAPAELLAGLQAIEARAGRTRSFRNAPRTLDLDLLLYGARRIHEPGLVVPHPRMHERAFVLVPLLELAPEAAIPGVGSARACLGQVAGQAVERLA